MSPPVIGLLAAVGIAGTAVAGVAQQEDVLRDTCDRARECLNLVHAAAGTKLRRKRGTPLAKRDVIVRDSYLALGSLNR